MRLPVHCNICLDLSPGSPVERIWVVPTETAIIHVECALGHKTIHVIESERFELLFDLALHAILDNYYRDAISSFASSLERFYEYALRVLAAQIRIPASAFSKTWKVFGKHSERQLGAYAAAFLIVEGRPPPLLSTKDSEFRNQVIHGGKLPSRAEAEAFGNSILAAIYDPLRTLRTKYRDASLVVEGETRTRLLSAQELHGIKLSRWSQALTLRDLHRQPDGPETVAHRLALIQQHMRLDKNAG